MSEPAVPFEYVALEADAEVLCGALRSAGVRCNYVVRVSPIVRTIYLWDRRGAYLVLVHEDDLARALEVHAGNALPAGESRRPSVVLIAAGVALVLVLAVAWAARGA